MEYLYSRSTEFVREGREWWRAQAGKVWNSHWTADTLLLIVALIWGTTYVAAKDVVSVVPVFAFLFIRFALTTVLMLPLTASALVKADRRTYVSGIIFGMLLLAIYSLETVGVVHTSAANAGFLISLFAVIVPMIESVVFRRLPKKGLVGAIMISLLGTGLLTLHGFHISMGDILILGAAAFRAIQMVVTKQMTAGHQMHSGALTTIQLAVVAVGSGVMTVIQHPSFSGMTVSFWLITAYLAIFATMFAFFVQLTMIRRTSPSRVAILLNSEPLFAAMFSVLLLGEHLSSLALVGGLLMMLGTIIARRQS